MDGQTDGLIGSVGKNTLYYNCATSVIGAFDLLLVLVSFLRSFINGMDGGGCCFF